MVLISGHLNTFKSYQSELGNTVRLQRLARHLLLRSGTDNVGAGLVFRQGSGLFCRTGLRSCNFWKPAQPPMLTGNACCSECIHAASTNKQHNTISTLWLHRKTGFQKEEGKREETRNWRRGSSQADGAGLSANSFFFYVKKLKETLTQTLTNTYICHTFSRFDFTHSLQWKVCLLPRPRWFSVGGPLEKVTHLKKVRTS